MCKASLEHFCKRQRPFYFSMYIYDYLHRQVTSELSHAGSISTMNKNCFGFCGYRVGLEDFCKRRRLFQPDHLHRQVASELQTSGSNSKVGAILT